jgi:hypothetical protein
MFAFLSPTSQRRIPGAVGVAGVVVILSLTMTSFTGIATSQTQAPTGKAPTARGIVGPAAVVPLTEQPPAKMVIDPPLPDQLANGHVVIQYRTENLRIMPVFGPAAAAVLPRIGHLHVTLDDAPWHWADTSNQEMIVSGLPPGPHKILIELADANHKVLDQGVVKFEVPRRPAALPDPKVDGNKPALNTTKPAPTQQPPAKLVVDPPLPEPLARGVAFIQYRTENVHIVPVFGPAALAVSPRLGHMHVTVDDAPWHWADASGGPVIVSDLPPGQHIITLELVDANHKVLDQSIVKFEVPRR